MRSFLLRKCFLQFECDAKRKDFYRLARGDENQFELSLGVSANDNSGILPPGWAGCKLDATSRPTIRRAIQPVLTAVLVSVETEWLT